MAIEMIDWNKIETVFLDMDGTLLDLHFDNHFWLSHVPQRYAERHGVNAEDAHADLAIRYQRVIGTMQWYCVDYWTRELSLDIEKLKEEVAHLIAVRPDVLAFLSFLRASGKRLTLVTNAHSKSLSLKMKRTELDIYFDAIICAHDLGMPKEQSGFWGKLQAIERFDPALTLLVDDSLPVLRSARDYGIAHLLAIHQPDSRQPAKNVEEFMAVERFNDIISC